MNLRTPQKRQHLCQKYLTVESAFVPVVPVGNDASLRGTSDQISLHPYVRDICAALLHHIHSLETPPDLE